MPIIQNRPVQRSILDNDRAALLGLRQRSDYRPTGEELSVAALVSCEAELAATEQAEILAINALAAARSAREAAGWKFHDLMLSAKACVIAQYGRDSDVVQEMGLKKRSDYKRRDRKKSQG